jgi:hypothetical protein
MRYMIRQTARGSAMHVATWLQKLRRHPHGGDDPIGREFLEFDSAQLGQPTSLIRR